jgi:pectate lyase
MKIKSPNASGSARNGRSSKTTSFFLFVILLFALYNPVSAALPFNELWREDLTDNVIGFGKNTIGGKGGTLCQVTNLNDSGAGSLRACAEAAGPMWIVFTVSGTITLQSVIHIKSYKTIDGRGQNIVVANRGITIGTWDTDTGPVSDVIIHNISMKNNYSNGMIIVAENASNVWIDHNTFQNAIDEILYVGSGSGFHRPPPSGVTISWNFFPTTTSGQGWGDKSLLVSDPSDTADVATTITLHHNRYQTYIRHPLARYAKIHAFNNYYEVTGRSLDLYTDVQFYSENEIFRLVSGAANPTIKLAGNEPWDPRGAANVKVLNPLLLNGATVQQVNASSIFNPSSYYAYSAEPANTALQTTIISNAGRQNVTTPILPQAPTNLVVK